MVTETRGYLVRIARETHHISVRLLGILLILAIFGALLALGGPDMLPLVMPAIIFLVAGLVWRPRGSSKRPEDTDGDGGGGPPVSPRPRPDAPSSGPPLPDADQPRRRLRDHDQPAWTPPRIRRPAREPERAPDRRRTYL